MLTTFPHLNEDTLSAANCVGEWLAQNDFATPPVNVEADLVVLAGNAVMPTIDAACRLAAENRTLLISGGIGHSTTFLYAAVARHPRYNILRTTARAEASILADIAHQYWNIPLDRIVVEDRSTNCGENARFTREVMEQCGITCRNGIVVQDPTMQRRTMATFAHVWQDDPQAPQWRSYPGYLPVLRNATHGLTFTDEADAVWPVERYLSLLLGELPRLLDDENGYGPRGKGFIAHVYIPDSVMAAWQTLREDSLLREALTSRSLL
ncbi:MULTISPECIES: YdcF family protein [Enterobacterales]|uniref:YdcF family protein n=1 Tax=Enterobacterales TaxID=91347 RepID=UPI002EDB1537